MRTYILAPTQAHSMLPPTPATSQCASPSPFTGRPKLGQPGAWPNHGATVHKHSARRTQQRRRVPSAPQLFPSRKTSVWFFALPFHVALCSPQLKLSLYPFASSIRWDPLASTTFPFLHCSTVEVSSAARPFCFMDGGPWAVAMPCHDYFCV